ncbi:MAG: hypothetical protein ACTIAG_06255 [Lactobacillus sp.]
MTKQKKSQLWTVLCAFACFMWGISGLFGKALFNLAPTVTALWLSQVRMMMAGLFLILIAAGDATCPEYGASLGLPRERDCFRNNYSVSIND